MPPNLIGNGAVLVVSNGQPVPGQYIIKNPVPIGTIMTLYSSGGGGGYGIISNVWSGGTDYGSYNKGLASDTVSGAQTLGFNGTRFFDPYVFIVDSTPRSYTVTDAVVYGNGAKGFVTLNFGSEAPTGSLSTVQLGVQQGGKDPNTNTYIVGLSPPIQIKASASTGLYTQGQFMFLQIVNSVYQGYTVNGVSKYFKNDKDYTNEPPSGQTVGQNFNGPLHDTSTLGYQFYYVNPPKPFDGNLYYVFGLAANSSTPVPGAGTPQMSDIPRFDSDSAVPTMVTCAEQFSTYLMYKANTNGTAVWIAVAELDWSWTETATMQGNTLVAPPSQQPAATASTPTGAKAFPTWVNTTTNFLDEGMNPPRTGSPGP